MVSLRAARPREANQLLDGSAGLAVDNFPEGVFLAIEFIDADQGFLRVSPDTQDIPIRVRPAILHLQRITAGEQNQSWSSAGWPDDPKPVVIATRHRRNPLDKQLRFVVGAKMDFRNAKHLARVLLLHVRSVSHALFAFPGIQ